MWHSYRRTSLLFYSFFICSLSANPISIISKPTGSWYGGVTATPTEKVQLFARLQYRVSNLLTIFVIFHVKLRNSDLITFLAFDFEESSM